MGAYKKHNSLIVDYEVDGLPGDWRNRVEDAVQHVGKLFDLYVTTVKAGVSNNPPRILISVAREGSEEAWNDQAEATLKARLLQVLETADDEEAVKRKNISDLQEGLAIAAKARTMRQIKVIEKQRDPHTLKKLQIKRTEVIAEVREKIEWAQLPDSASDLIRLALDRMKRPDRWCMWVQILLSVDLASEAIGSELELRLRSLI
ncbi:MAG: hypothetical protein GY898_33575 [Proteobacteria bacterium]|nr:hypothetical protein [Pseudomonadota bacterium]